MVKRRKLSTTSSALIVPVLAVLATVSAYAGTSPNNTAPHPQVAPHLTEFKRTAFEMRREADTLQSFTRHKSMHWQSHTGSLHTLNQHVNDLGKRLAELVSLKPMATELQQMAIEQTRPHLVSTARHLTEAIEMINENRRIVHQPEYAEVVRNLHAHVDSLYEKLDTILDYEKAGYGSTAWIFRQLRQRGVELSELSTRCVR